MDDDQREEIEDIAKDGQAVHSMVNSNGWQKVVRPAIEKRHDALFRDFTTAKTYEDFVRIQQAVNASVDLMSLIEVTLNEGKEALTELRIAEHP
jgi:hypothetical protein